MRIIQYRVVESRFLSDVVDEVNRLIQDTTSPGRWLPQGGIVTSGEDRWCCQAMVLVQSKDLDG